MRNLSKLSILAALATLVLSTGANAAATDRSQVAINFNKTVALTSSGRAALDRRIYRAAMTVCNTGTGSHIIDTRCVAEAVARAKGDLDLRLAAAASPAQLASK